jgi:reactive intermediate/imine deaminase
MAGNADTPTYVTPADMPTPSGHYSPACVGNGFVFVSGQIPSGPDGVPMVAASFEDQARQTLANVAAALRGAGSGIDKLVQVRVYIDSMDNWPAFNTVYAEWAGQSRPARAVIPVGPLHHGLLVEIEATALA